MIAGSSNVRFVTVIATLGFATVSALAQQNTSIISTPHNLSASGPGAIRASSEQEICIFCHTAHNSSPIQPLWNRNLPVNAYTAYASSSLQAHPGQPTGSSKLCLSCHDGTIALGSVLSREQPIAMAGGITTLPPGHSNLGTDLSDDHPISFRYDTALVSQDPKLKLPVGLPEQVKLDRNQELQCTSCHDAHNNQWGKFLVMNNANSQLCSACHQPGNTAVEAHTSCDSCHAMHSAPSGAMLLKAVNSSETCLTCHSGQAGPTQGKNVSGDLNKLSRHYQQPGSITVTNPANPPSVDPNAVVADTVTCSSCHEPHTMQSGSASAPAISPKLGSIAGVNGSGAKVPVAQFQYEVCFKCHQSLLPGKSMISRQIVQANPRMQFSPSAVSFHPVEAAGKGTDVPSLRTPGMNAASIIYCTDCHNSDTGKTSGGSGTDGPHGSNESPLLVARYDTVDNTSESALAYALCYRCHDRTSILSDESFKGHKLHIVDQKTPCSVCHDSHGISSAQGTAQNHAHLINFDTSVVQPSAGTNTIEYRSLGAQTGQCTLSCHGADHAAQMYPSDTSVIGGQPGTTVRPRTRTLRPSVPSGSKLPQPGHITPSSPSRQNPTRF